MSERPADPPSLPEQLDDIATDLRQWAGELEASGVRLALLFAAVHVDAAAACVRLAIGDRDAP